MHRYDNMDVHWREGQKPGFLATLKYVQIYVALYASQVAQNPPANAGDAEDTGDAGSNPGMGRAPGQENGNPL